MTTQYRIPVEETFSWQRPVIDKDLNTPPAIPAKGDRYIVGPSPTGAWVTHAGHIAWCSNATGPVWSFDIPSDGWVTIPKDEDLIYIYSNTAWIVLPADHTHTNKTTLDAIEQALTTALKTAYDGAVTDKHTHSNKATLDAIEQAFTTALKANYDEAYSRRGSFDTDLGCILMTI